jgi:thiol-disulfide isomerase/thioredoxin
MRAATLLEKTPTPLAALELARSESPARLGLDTRLVAFKGDPDPPPLSLPNLEDGRVESVDFAGRVTVVNFWATWCPPCVEEIPSLNRLRQRMQGKPFALISVDYAEDRKRVVEFLEKVDVHFPVLLDGDGSVAASWGALVFPSTFVVGPDGKIVYGVNGAIEWDSDEVVKALEALL